MKQDSIDYGAGTFATIFADAYRRHRLTRWQEFRLRLRIWWYSHV